MSRSFDVLLGTTLVGYLVEDDAGAVSFRFADSYRNLTNRPVLSQSFEDDLERVYKPQKRSQLPSFFANLIPEGALRRLIDKQWGLEPGDDLGLLEVVGIDVPGATIIQPSKRELAGLDRSDPTEADVQSHDPTAVGLRFSLAGVQLKFSISDAGDRLTLAARGEQGTWIAKLEAAAFPHVVANEYSVMIWARETGFEVPDCRIATTASLQNLPSSISEPEVPVLLVRRFDRTPTTRIHQEDFAQVVGYRPDLKYDHLSYSQLAGLVEQIVGSAAREEFVRRLAFMIVSGNADAHLKNWSLLYGDPVQPTLSPLYDQVATVAWPDLARTLALNFGSVKDFGRIDRKALERFSEQAGSNPAVDFELITSTIASARAAWSKVVERLPMCEAHKAALVAHWERTPIVRETKD